MRMPQRLLQLLREARAAGHCCFTPGDFCYRWQTETSTEKPPKIHTWTDAHGEDIAFAWLSDQDLHIITRDETPGLRRAMFEWGEARLRERNGASELLIPIADRATAWHSLLGDRGYCPGEPELVTYGRTLESGSLSPPHIPTGYQIRTVSDASGMRSWVQAYREAFAPETMPLAVRTAINESPLYRADLDLIACDESGRVAALALAWFDPVTASGTFEPVGCVPPHQRRGLARALIDEGLWRLRVLDARDAYVITTRRRVPANRLYASAGFQVVSSCRTWSPAA